MRAWITIAVFFILGVLCVLHKSSAGFMIGLAMFLFAFVVWIARPRKGKDHEV